MDWTYDNYWQKSKLYVQRAMDTKREDALFPFWSALALEFLGRATLAKIHPVLVADPQEGEYILYAFGYPSNKPPKTIGATTVFKRCQRIIEDFTEDDYDKCIFLIEKRNEELHSGAAAFNNLPNHSWLTGYYRICKILLASQNKSLIDLFGEDEANAAEIMIEENQEGLIKIAKDLVSQARKRYNQLSDTDKENAKEKSSLRRQLYMESEFYKELTCFVCGANALLEGELISPTEPRVEDEEVVYDLRILPTSYKCFGCDLELNSFGLLRAAGVEKKGDLPIAPELSSQFTVTKSYYDTLDIEPDYGND